MHTNIGLIVTLAGSLAAALAFGYLTHRLGLSPIVGYLLAGIAVGPNTPGFVADRHLAEQLADVGVILLMFGVGLHFHIRELLAVRRIALPGAITQSLVATLFGAITAWAFGWGWTAGVVYGLALSVASTVVLTRVLTDHNDLHTPASHMAVGWLVIEDVFTVVVLVLLPVLFRDSEPSTGAIVAALSLAALKLGVLVVLTVVLGSRLIPWLLEHMAATGSRELVTLTVLVVAMGIAVGSATLFDVSMALGAFLAGMVVGRSDFSLRAASEALPMRDAFAVLFFVSAGLLFDPRSLLSAPGLVAATLAVIMIAKPLAALTIVLFMGYPWKAALAVAAALAQIGEFSFILAGLGKSLGLLPDAAINALVAAAIISISLNPIVYRMVGPLDAWAARQRHYWRRLAAWVRRKQIPSGIAPSHQDLARSPRHRAVVVGYGPVGHTLARLLRINEIEPTIIELNLDTVRRLREGGMSAIYGDAAHAETLRAAGIAQAASLILSASGVRGAAEVIRLARELNPRIRVVVRTAYLREGSALRQAGADRVFTGEGEVALAMTESVLRDLGATPEQIERERDRVRAELFGGSPGSDAAAASSAPAPSSSGPQQDSTAEKGTPANPSAGLAESGGSTPAKEET